MAAQHAIPSATVANERDAPYTLHSLLSDVPLHEDPDDDEEDIYITAVDVWEGNLYIGTSAADLLHFVSFPAEDSSKAATWILASRQKIDYSNEQEGADKGVKQILVLPGAEKACILCNGTLTFYTLPELSPAFGGKIRQGACLWVGGLDLSDTQTATEPVVVVCLRQRLRMIRIGDDARKIRDIELGDVRNLQRRVDLACVADGTSYSLLDVVNQRKNELFPIASTQESSSAPRTQNLAPSQAQHGQSRSFSSTSPLRFNRGHTRGTSLGSTTTGSLDSQSAWPARGSSRESPNRSPRGDLTPEQDDRRHSIDAKPEATKVLTGNVLPSNIASPTPTEFLLTTGTRYTDPGVGLYVNLEGDVVRGTVEFSSYPDALVLDQATPSADRDSISDTHILALVRQNENNVLNSVIEVQQIEADASVPRVEKSFVSLPFAKALPSPDAHLLGTGLRITTSTAQLGADDIGRTLRQRRLHLNDEGTSADDLSATEKSRNEQEDKFAGRFNSISSRVLVFGGTQVSWIVRSSMVTRLNTDLQRCLTANEESLIVDTNMVHFVLGSIRGQEASDELEFVTLTYVRQRGAFLLFAKMLQSAVEGKPVRESESTTLGRALEESDLDPRILLSLLPTLQQEVQEGQQGIWIAQGIVDTYVLVKQKLESRLHKLTDWSQPGSAFVLHVVKAYLILWRKKKGFGSVADEALVFNTIDAALIHILLILDRQTPRGPAIANSVRAELNEIVDRGVDCFDRASALFKQFDRVYMLSRLFQSRKMSSQVLACWRRIIEGEYDAGGELIEGEIDLRRYLARLRDKDLVIEYGTWLANRDPKLGVQVFADESAKTRFEPKEAVTILQEKAPVAVKVYLEHLVFAKHQVQYVNELISFYLSTVLAVLSDGHSTANALLRQTTDTYRALRPPKPTFSDFITDNSIDAEWWSNRLRLLQLIGGSHGGSSRYDVPTLRAQLAPYSDILVPEMIILNGREGKHKEAVHLLVAGLCDYDTAIRYCLLGGSSIFHPPSATAAERPPMPSQDEQGQLFRHLLHEFLAISDPEERIERSSELLERFGGWFDVHEVLSLVPLDWTVDVINGFLVSALRALIQERNETSIAKALAGAQNLRTSATMVEKIESLRPVVVTEEAVDTTVQ